jgi:small subunit ribosomal protein S16
MVVIRLARFGSKKRPKYRITVADSRRHATKKFIEVVGSYDPTQADKAKRVVLVKDRIDYWVGQGAQATDRVKHLLKQTQAQ